MEASFWWEWGMLAAEVRLAVRWDWVGKSIDFWAKVIFFLRQWGSLEDSYAEEEADVAPCVFRKMVLVLVCGAEGKSLQAEGEW